MPNKYEVIVVGAGAAGIIATIESAKRGNKTLIIERTREIGKKILVCGAGRCNLTNINVAPERYHGAGSGFTKSVIDQFGSIDILEYFDKLGVKTYVENKGKGKVFPITDQALTITEVLKLELEKYEVDIVYECEVNKISKENDLFIINTNMVEDYTSHKLILSAGGKSYPALGSNGSGYDLAVQLGHKIITPVPSALPLLATDPICKKLQGVRLKASVKAVIAGEVVDEDVDDILFTAFGLSGSVIFNISRPISVRINREHLEDCEVIINFFPEYTKEKLKEEIQDRIKRFPNRKLKNLYTGLLNEKIINALVSLSELDENMLINSLTKDKIRKLADLSYEYRVKIEGTKSWNEAEFTAGGVDSREVDRRTLESKIIKGLFFAGEILDVDGDVGGFNLTWAWSSGFVAGKYV